MGRDVNEANHQRQQNKKKQSPRSRGKLVNYNLTTADREYLRQGIFGPLEALELLETFMDDGMRVSMGGSADKGGYFLIIREGIEDWQEALSVAFWGGSMEKCITMAGYYLREINPAFPDRTQSQLPINDW